MKPFRRRGWLLAACLLLFLLAVVAAPRVWTRPYSRPVVSVIVPANGSAKFDGLLSLATPDEKVIWTHGVCPTDYRWVKDRVALVLAAFGPSASVTDGPTRTYAVDGVPDRLLVYNKIFHVPSGSQHHNLSMYFVIWSNMMDDNRNALSYDWSNPLVHASFNRSLKRFFDRCLVDAMVYVGAKGPKVRSAIQMAMRDVMADTLGGNESDGLAIVSESLGSKILYDSIVSAPPDLVASLDKVSGFFMIANQIPLEDQAEDTSVGHAAPVSPPNTSKVARLLATIRTSRSNRPVPRNVNGTITLVAFSDPNDAMSQDLKPEFIQDDAAHVLNIAVSNADTYFGYAELPNLAHCGYGANQQVINMVVTGDPNRGAPVPDSVLHLACTSDSIAAPGMQ